MAKNFTLHSKYGRQKTVLNRNCYIFFWNFWRGFKSVTWLSKYIKQNTIAFSIYVGCMWLYKHENTYILWGADCSGFLAYMCGKMSKTKCRKKGKPRGVLNSWVVFYFCLSLKCVMIMIWVNIRRINTRIIKKQLIINNTLIHMRNLSWK